MNLYPKNITINNKQFGVSQLFADYETKPEWEKDIFDFLKTWYSSSDFIEVKTSGSTGKPKKIRLQKEFVAKSAVRTLQFFGLKKGDKILHCLPSKFIAGKLMIVRALIGELNMHIVDPKSDFQLLRKESFGFAAMVPNQVLKLLKIDPENWNVKQLLIGGDAIPLALETQLAKVQTACFSSYGMTETATHIALRKINGKEADYWYRCLDGIKVGQANNGCLQIFMPDMPEEPIITNDLAEIQNENTFRILGRIDNVIISGGVKYAPEAIERKLDAEITTPFYISSQAHKKLGQQIVLVVEGEENEALRQELNVICKKTLTKFEQPRKIIFVPDFPKTENGKTIRKPVS